MDPGRGATDRGKTSKDIMRISKTLTAAAGLLAVGSLLYVMPSEAGARGMPWGGAATAPRQGNLALATTGADCNTN